MNKIKFIYCDLNKLVNVDLYPLKNRIILDAIKEGYGDIKDGLTIWLYAPTFKNGKFDPSVFRGVIRIDKNGEESGIEAKEADMIFLSDSTQFSGYSIEDIVGTDMYESLKKDHPEWF